MRLRYPGILLSSLIVQLLVASISLSASCGSGFDSGVCKEEQYRIGMASPILGGIHDSRILATNSVEAEELGRFAVDEHNKKQNAMLEFAKVVEAKEQVVAGTLHHLLIEAKEAGKKKLYEAKVWVKPWLNFKELQEFNYARDAFSFTSSDLGANPDGHRPGWQSVPPHDPTVQDAAHHALKTIQQRSNSLFPYELQEIVNAKAEVADEFAKLLMLLKVKRGSREEKLKIEVHRSAGGAFHLNHMEPHADDPHPESAK